MKIRKSIAGLLSFLMALSLLLGISAAPVYAVGGEGETASFEIREANGQTGTVQYKLDGSGDFISANNSTLVALNGATSITIKAIPNGDAQVNQSTSWISGTEEAVTFDYGALISESGWTYNIQDNDGNITFTIEFDNHDGTGGGSNPGGGGGEGGEGTYTVYFGEGSWEIGGVTVTADKTDVQYLAENDIITLENFDPETMEVRVEAEDGFWTTLAVTDGQTSISAHTNDGVVPTDIAFSVVEKSSNPGENVYYIDLGTGSWTVGDVTVSAPEGMSGVVSLLDTETIPTEMLANFDPDTMDAVLIVDENVTLRLNVDENGNTRLADVDGGVEVLPPYGAMMIFSVVKKPVDNEEFETESYTLTDDKGNVISLTYEKNRELSFTMIDYLAFSPEDLETMGIPQELYDSTIEGIANATKQHGTLLSFYEIQVENDDGFLIHEGPFYIKIKMTDEMKKYDIFKIVYIDAEDNFATESPITLTQEGGYLVGTLEHLSTYALVGDNAPSAPTYTVSFDANGGTGTMVDVTGISGEYTLPENGFTAPDGKQFKAWSVGGVEKAAGDNITVTADTTVIATWENINVSPSNPDYPQTGDNSNLGLWVFLLVLSCCSMIALIVIDKKRKIAK